MALHIAQNTKELKRYRHMAGTIDIRELNEKIERQSGFITNLMAGMDQVIVGQTFRESHRPISFVFCVEPLEAAHSYKYAHGCNRYARPRNYRRCIRQCPRIAFR